MPGPFSRPIGPASPSAYASDSEKSRHLALLARCATPLLACNICVLQHSSDGRYRRVSSLRHAAVQAGKLAPPAPAPRVTRVPVGWRPHAAKRAAGGIRTEPADVLRAVYWLQQQAGARRAKKQSASWLVGAYQVLPLPGAHSPPRRSLIRRASMSAAHS